MFHTINLISCIVFYNPYVVKINRTNYHVRYYITLNKTSKDLSKNKVHKNFSKDYIIFVRLERITHVLLI